ncbi:MAG: sigma-70 family RNA polymerase sigma factor [Proteobacteria bacterium]|nr:sigma-70 family RNA polymerase sigma factor [Pseudomonadota bacterium]
MNPASACIETQPIRCARQSFGSLAAKYRNLVRSHLARLGVTASSLDDAQQDVLVGVWLGQAKFARRSSVGTWISGVCRNVASEYKRRAQRQRKLEYIDGRQPSSASSPEQRCAWTQEARRVGRLLQGLDHTRRDTLIEVALEHRAVAEVAREQGVTPAAVYARLRSARSLLERQLRILEARDRSHLTAIPNAAT